MWCDPLVPKKTSNITTPKSTCRPDARRDCPLDEVAMYTLIFEAQFYRGLLTCRRLVPSPQGPQREQMRLLHLATCP